MPTFQNCALISSVLMKALHLISRVSLSLLNATLENEYLLLLGGEFILLVAQGCFYSFEYLDVVLDKC